jgi:hypothetical protein
MRKLGIIQSRTLRIHPGHEETMGHINAGCAGFGRARGDKSRAFVSCEGPKAHGKPATPLSWPAVT